MATEWIFRPATPGDIPALHGLVERAYRGDAARAGWTHEADLLGGQRVDREGLVEILASPRDVVLVAEAGGALVGCVRLSEKPGRRAHLGMLAVEPTRQAAGLGRVLLAAAEAEARARFDATLLEMTVIRQRAELIAYYARRGYLDTGREEPFPIDDPRFGLPKRRDLVFSVLEKPLLGSVADSTFGVE